MLYIYIYNSTIIHLAILIHLVTITFNSITRLCTTFVSNQNKTSGSVAFVWCRANTPGPLVSELQVRQDIGTLPQTLGLGNPHRKQYPPSWLMLVAIMKCLSSNISTAVLIWCSCYFHGHDFRSHLLCHVSVLKAKILGAHLLK